MLLMQDLLWQGNSSVLLHSRQNVEKFIYHYMGVSFLLKLHSFHYSRSLIYSFYFILIIF